MAAEQERCLRHAPGTDRSVYGAYIVLLEPDILPSFTPKQLEDRGMVLSAAARNHAGLLALVALPMGESAAPHYVLGTDNLYAITRYNWSSQYAMAVIDLAQAIEAAAQTQP